MEVQVTETNSPSKEIDLFNAEAVGLVEQAKRFIVADKEDYEGAKVFRDAINTGVKERKDFIEPRKKTAKAGWQLWVDLEKDLIALPEQAIQIVGAKMTAWYREEQRKAEEKEAELRAKAEEQDLDPELVTVEAPKVKGQRKVYKYKVVDFAKLPDEYKVEGSRKLGALARSSQGSANVPGVEFSIDTTTTS